VWIGPGAFLDARDLVIGDYVGWGPGAKVLGSEHVAQPVEDPIIQTDLVIAPVRIGSGADVGTGAVILPGVTVGAGAIVGAAGADHVTDARRGQAERWPRSDPAVSLRRGGPAWALSRPVAQRD
jgi:NDP-sugar pyrophosphorylase family protein